MLEAGSAALVQGCNQELNTYTSQTSIALFAAALRISERSRCLNCAALGMRVWQASLWQTFEKLLAR